MQNKFKPLEIFQYFMIGVYFIVGLLIMINPSWIGQLQGWPRYALAAVIMLYAFFRGYLIYYKQSSFQSRRNIEMVLLLFIPTFFSCNYNPNKAGAWSDLDTVTVLSDETFKPIILSGSEVFLSTDTLSEMDLKFVPENIAINSLLNGDAQMAVVSRNLTQAERVLITEKKRVAKSTKIATDAIALIVHKSNTTDFLTIDGVRKILLGEHRTWNQVNSTGKSDSIRVIFDNKNSGIIRYMIDSVCGGKDLAANMFAVDIDADVINFVSKNSDAIGFIGATWISDPNDTLHLSFHEKIKVLGVSSFNDGTIDDSYKPYQAYLLNGMYPFTRDIYMLNIEPKDGKATRFSAFMCSDRGQRIILKSGILPTVAPTRMIKVSTH